MSGVVQVSTEVAAPVERVWRVVSDPRNLPQWDSHILAVEGVPSDGLSEGSEYVTVMRLMGAKTRVGAWVVDLKPNEYAKVRLHGLVDAVVETWVEPRSNGTSLLRHRVEYTFRGGPVGDMAARAVSLLGASTLVKRGMLAQKRQIEGEG